MLLHVEVGSSVEKVSLVVLKLLLHVWPELGVLAFSRQLFMEGNCVADGCNVLEVYGIGYFETSHAVTVPPLLEVHFESPAAPVRVIAAYLTFVFDSQPMELVQPVGNGLTVPSEGQILGIVDWCLGLFFRLLFFLNILYIFVAPCLFLSHQVHRVVNHVGQLFAQL